MIIQSKKSFKYMYRKQWKNTPQNFYVCIKPILKESELD